MQGLSNGDDRLSTGIKFSTFQLSAQPEQGAAMGNAGSFNLTVKMKVRFHTAVEKSLRRDKSGNGLVSSV
jgi:hypothetical protein